MKHILIVSAVFPPEQVTSAFLNYDLAHELAKEYDVTVLRPYPTRPIGAKFESAEVEDKSFKTILVDSYTHPQSELLCRFRESIDFGKRCASYIKQHKNEIDFIYDAAWQLFGVYIVARAAKKNHIPYMTVIQDIYPESIMTGHHYPALVEKTVMTFLKPLDKYYQQNAYRVRTISDEMGDYLSTTRNIPRDKYLIVNNWQNDEDFSGDVASKSSDKLRFAYVGSINVHSNTDLIIRAFYHANIPGAELYIYGGGNRKEYCEALVQELGMNNVVFDQVSRDRVPQVQGEAAAFSIISGINC